MITRMATVIIIEACITFWVWIEKRILPISRPPIVDWPNNIIPMPRNNSDNSSQRQMMTVATVTATVARNPAEVQTTTIPPKSFKKSIKPIKSSTILKNG